MSPRVKDAVRGEKAWPRTALAETDIAPLLMLAAE